MDDTLEAARTHHEPGWAKAYPLWCAVLRAKGLRTGAEIGVAFGGHSEAMLRSVDLARLYSVDRFRHDPGYEDAMNFPQHLFDELYQSVQGRLASFGDRCQLMRAESSEAARLVPDELDFVYIDADHSYEGVWADLKLWAGKVREGGIIGGHDYGHPDFPGVKAAIDRFFNRFGWQIHEEGEGVWWTIREPVRLSFIVPAYNCQQTIEESISSIAQDNLSEGDEIVVVDDGSTDGTPEILERLRQASPFIAVRAHRHNRGTASGARNTAIEAATHNILFCLDSDNLLAPGSVRELTRHLFGSGADAAAFGEIHFFLRHVREVTHKWVFADEIGLADALSGAIWPGPSGNYMFTRASWLRAGRYVEPYLENRSLETWVFAIHQLGTGSQLVTLPGTWYFHRYGYESHYMRNWQKGNQSLTALMALIPLLDLLEAEDVEYIFGREGRYTWFDHLKEHPVRVKEARRGVTGEIRQLHVPWRWRLRQKAAVALEKAARRLKGGLG